MAQQVRYGLVGTGMMGVEHLANLAITPGAVVTAIADPVATSLAWATGALKERADRIFIKAGTKRSQNLPSGRQARLIPCFWSR